MNAEIHQRIADALSRLGSLARAREHSSSQAERLSPLQARALVTLLRRNELRVGLLAEELLVTVGTLSAAVSALVEKGLVSKHVDPEEHRAIRLRLTRKGAAAAKRAEGWGADVLEPAVAELPSGDAAALLGSLLKLIRAYERKGLIAQSRMCVSCRYFAPGRGKGKKPHYCHLLEESIGNGELQVDCPDHEDADPQRQEELWKQFEVSWS